MTKKHSRYDLIHSPAYHEATPVVLVFSIQHPTIYIVNDYLKKLYSETHIQQKIWKIIGPTGLKIDTHSLGKILRQDYSLENDDHDESTVKLEAYFYDNFKKYIDDWLIKEDHKRCTVDFKFETQCTLGDVRNLSEEQLENIIIVADSGVSYEII